MKILKNEILCERQKMIMYMECRRRLSRIIGLLLLCVSIAMLFSCKAKDHETYKEMEIMLPAGMDSIWDVCVTSEGNLKIAMTEEDSKKGYIFESDDSGKSWERLFCYTDAMGIEDCRAVDCFVRFSPQGDFISMVVDNGLQENSSEQTRCYYVDLSGKALEIKNKMPESGVSESMYIGDGFSYDGAIADEENLIASNQSGETYLINKNTGEITDSILGSDNLLFSPAAFMVEGDDLYLLGTDDVVQYSIKDRKIVQKNDKTLKKLKETYTQSDMLGTMSAKDGDFYFFNEDGIQKFSDGKKRQLIGDEDMSVMPSEVYGRRICFDEKERIYLAINNEKGEAGLLRYEKTDTKEKGEKDILDIYTLSEDEGVRKIAEHYQKHNENVKVNVIVGMEEENTGLDDAVKKLNTNILGGDGPDILFLDGIEAENYVENNILMQLDGEVKSIDNEDNIRKVMDKYVRDGKAYAVPLRFVLPVVLSKYDDVLTAEDGTEFVDRIISHDAEISEYVFADYVRFYYQIFVEPETESGNVSRSDLGMHLDNIKKLHETQKSSGKVQLTHLNLPPQQTVGSTEYLLGNDDRQIDYIFQGQQLQILQQIESEEYRVASINGKVYYMPRLIVSINAATDNEEVCRDFISYALSEEGQKVAGESVGLSINKKVLKNTLEELKEDQALIGNEITNRSVPLHELPEDRIDDFMDIAGSVNMQTNNNNIAMDIFMEYTEKYLNGEVRKEKAVKEITDRLELYGNE